MPRTSDTAPAAGAGTVPGERTVAQLVFDRWHVELTGEHPSRFHEPGWVYTEEVPFPCPSCHRGLHTLRKPFVLRDREQHFAALVCPPCALAYTLRDLGLTGYAGLKKPPPRTTPPPNPPVSSPPRSSTPQRPAGAGLPAVSGAVWGPPRPRQHERAQWPADLPRPVGPETRRLHWVKITQPDWSPESLPDDCDLRVILPDSERFQGLADRLGELSVPFRRMPHWLESEEVTTVDEQGVRTDPVARPRVPGESSSCSPVGGLGAYAARDCFDLAWESLAPAPREAPPYRPVTDLVPEAWAPFLPYPTFNPSQSVAVPVVLGSDGHVVVVAPTGAGKTQIGMVGALKAYFAGRKVVWLVPQRSLTDELDRDLELWRRNGLHVVRLSGEQATDQEQMKQADIWISTTEKFEALCRSASMRQTLADVGCLVVDEIHLLGDPVRGPILEALLARVRETATEVRIVGLSATVSNAEDIAEWLNAELVRVTWRPTRLVWQLPLLPASFDRTSQQGARTNAVVRITTAFAAEQGSVLVFCGSKRNVRTTALAIAASRGTSTTKVDPDDADKVHQVCRAAGVGLHYSDWPYKHDTVADFTRRETDVVVATSTLAAGVNLPARAVVVRDTRIGLDDIEVSMVQQMFGRAGRAGAGEREGWAYLLTDEAERPLWQARLAAGYAVSSQIGNSLPDHVLAEVVQRRITTVPEAYAWWKQTLAYHQGHHDLAPLTDALQFLVRAEYLEHRPLDESDIELTATELGLLTARLMVSAVWAHEVRTHVGRLELPTAPETAEGALIETLSNILPDLAVAPVGERMRDSVHRLLKKKGYLHADAQPQEYSGGLAAPRGLAAGDFARACLLAVARSPRSFRAGRRHVGGIPVEAMHPVFNEAERYLYWLGAQGTLNSTHPWAAIVASDLARRIRWRRIGPSRGSGRLLWILEQMATPAKSPELVPQMWTLARTNTVHSPDWNTGGRPELCRISEEEYTALLRERTTGSRVDLREKEIVWQAPVGHSVVVWNGPHYHRTVSDGEEHTTPSPLTEEENGNNLQQGIAVFSRRGDGVATGWLSDYSRTSKE
ncbi:DEAD/DEAH box helicase domain protein [Actinobacteria bacterium OK074]|nr:DEAD/DEAH box helicase domain protein [Actinobacteria bacterium OK074]